jgi:hypothetical protein
LAPVRRAAKSKRARPLIVSLEYRIESDTLAVIEARHGKFANTIQAQGDLPEPAQLDAIRLVRYADAWPPDAALELIVERSEIVVRCGRSSARFPRTDLDPGAKIVRKPLPANRRHKGKVEVPPDPVGKREAWNDMWAFSARVPMPGHRIKKK